MATDTNAANIDFDLQDFDHENERSCELVVSPATLTATFYWSLEINEDYLNPDAKNAPQPFAHSEKIVFDSGDRLADFVANALRDLKQNCYTLYRDGSEIDEVDEILGDLDPLKGLSATSERVDLESLEEAYGQVLPESLRSFLKDGDWRDLDKRVVLDLPGESVNGKFLGVDYATIDFLGQNLIENAELYRKPGMCAFAKFCGQGLGLTYYGVVQADAEGNIFVTTRHDDVHCIANDADELGTILSKPRKIKRKGAIRRL